ncbi:oligoendopeptidase, pepF/M3 family [Paenibacillus curdlanolyticus YK9]|uniref:Oligoendopeptidase, pepF/M3 family n=1 Tax=Paenibacillus curdlanolyticus YK9 TaxID=717606 RepID=E0I6U7_9BACL|nr:M3 family oligoendopeptidase [Paenibacillus curdlanolyticus]EFM11763.1 oligoendopeptidase, pepF/M3 family [Paenibacillus curdlanolyticus YK9]
MSGNYPITWELDSIYPGGSSSEAFKNELSGTERDIAALIASLEEAAKAGSCAEAAVSEDAKFQAHALLTAWTEAVQSITLRLREADSFVACLMSQNMKDTAANGLNDRVKTISARMLGALTKFDAQLVAVPDQIWQSWLAEGPAGPAAFALAERRDAAREKLSPALEELAGDLAVDGYHGWGELYNTIVSRAKFQVTEADGTSRVLSAGQMHNRLFDADRAVREAAMAEWEREWSDLGELIAEPLNRLGGFRLKLYGHRNWTNVLKEPLAINRMSEATLNAMWAAVEESKPDLVRYMERKAKLLGIPKLDWHDVEAPISSTTKTVPFDEAAAFIVERFRQFSPDMAEFSEMAFRDGWIEAEDRAGKRPGGFCTSFPKSEQTRIFMTYSGTASNVSTLAHELGHAYHQHVMNDLPPLAQDYAMNVAETASTFAEMLVSDAAVKLTDDDGEKLALLEDKVQRAVAFFMNIHARFLFETRFYAKRKEGLVTAEELSELMEEAQREAFSGQLGSVHPSFWASKLHFYLTDVPFYNFPYTFGFLFSSGIYARAQREGEAFAERYVALLRDTGRMTVEELAKKHLGVDLEQPDFWREAVALTKADIEQFLAMTE